MTIERDPIRWLDAGAECDPALRDALEHARRSVPGAARAEALERSIEAQVTAAAVDSSTAPWRRSSAFWLGAGVTVVGLAAALVYLGVARRADEGVPMPRGGETLERGASAMPGSEAAEATRERSASVAKPPAKREAEPGTSSSDAPSQQLAVEPAAAAPRVRVQQTRVGPPRAAESAPRIVPKSRAASAHASDSSTAGPRATAASPEPNEQAGAPRAASSSAPEQVGVPPELQLLMAAQQALRVSPAKALAFTEQHGRAYPAGSFAAEREEIAITALFALGEVGRARSRAGAFLERYPSSLARKRVERLLERTP